MQPTPRLTINTDHFPDGTKMVDQDPITPVLSPLSGDGIATETERDPDSQEQARIMLSQLRNDIARANEEKAKKAMKEYLESKSKRLESQKTEYPSSRRTNE